MSLVQLESFVAVAEEGHLGRAARRLHLSQPPLTRRIRNLEDELGTELFERTPRGMRLRPEATEFLEHVRDILARVEAARASIGTVHPAPERARPREAQPDSNRVSPAGSRG